MTTPKTENGNQPHLPGELKTLLDSFLMEWKKESIVVFANKLTEQFDENSIQERGMTELVKVDIKKRWATGKGKLIEDYFRFSNFDASNVDAHLLMIELKARQAAGDLIAVSDYHTRFPHLKAEFKRLLKQQTSDQAKQTIAPEQSSVVTAAPNASESPNLGLPKTFGRYQVQKQLGAGAMGSVHLAYDSVLDRKVALKTPSFNGNDDETAIARFYQEAKSAAKLQHRNLCPIFDVGEIEGTHFIAMAFIEGQPLSNFVDPQKLPPERTIAILFHKLTMGMDEAHQKNIIHRDLKPANVMIDKKREPVVMDFGLAKQTDQDIHMTQSGTILGTPAYMSPEQLSGEPDAVNKKSDIYAMGVMMYELLTGTLPFTGTLPQVVGQILQSDPKPPTSLNPAISPVMEAICMKMMAKNPAHRYESMAAAAADLKGYLIKTKSGNGRESSRDQGIQNEGLNTYFDQAPSLPAAMPGTDSTSTPTAQESTTSKSNSKTNVPLLILGGVAGLILLAGLVYWAFLSGPQPPTAAATGKNQTQVSSQPVLETNQTEEGDAEKPDSTQNGDGLPNRRRRGPVGENRQGGRRTGIAGSGPIANRLKQNRGLTDRQLLTGNSLDTSIWKVIGRGKWDLNDGNLTAANRKNPNASGWLMCHQEVENFELEFEYRLPDQGNSGIYFRAYEDGNVDGTEFYEIQLIDESVKGGPKLPPNQQTGSIVNLVGVEKSNRPAANTWHSMTVRVVGQRIQVWLNNEKIAESLFKRNDKMGSHIGIQHYPNAQFRNMTLRSIDR